ncbi:hypothetical protein LP415_20210 [Polaromonas sp. P1(28)-8]|nr:hypothetical protein LP415_20210 [Polaromonas sp. P1(28)-8]
MPVIGLDQLISFEPLALPLYLSLWVYVSLLPAFFRHGANSAAMALPWR